MDLVPSTAIVRGLFLAALVWWQRHNLYGISFSWPSSISSSCAPVVAAGRWGCKTSVSRRRATMGLRRPGRLRSDSGDLNKDAVFGSECSCRCVFYISMGVVWVEWGVLVYEHILQLYPYKRLSEKMRSMHLFFNCRHLILAYLSIITTIQVRLTTTHE
jgi:hypothetical protein